MRRFFFFSFLALFTVNGCSLFRATTKSYQPEMVFIEGGIFEFGDVFEGTNTDALPVHAVEIRSFYLGKYEITFEEYDSFALSKNRELPSSGNFGRGKRAVVDITWDDAMAFCESLGYRLPTEAEWEYAARSGGKEYLFSGTSDPDSLKNYGVTRSSNINFSFVVGSKKPNKLGLYDMSGNVFEWIHEFYQFYSMPGNMHDYQSDGIRIIRGGSFAEETVATRTYWRVGTLRDVKATDIGFRCASDP